MSLAIQGYDGGASVPSDLSTCLATADYQPGTDILVVRRASTSTICPVGKTCPTVVPATPVGTLVANQMYIQTTPLGDSLGFPILGLGPSAAPFILTLPAANSTALPEKDAPLRRYLVRIYFVSKCNVPASGNPDDPCNGVTDDGGTPIPTLKMLEYGVDSTGNPGFRKIALAEGIEQLQFDYGIDTTADGVADNFVMCDSTTPCAVADWRNIVAVQVNLVARNAERSPSYADDKTYSLGLKGYTTATNDGYRRHAYTSLVRLNNIAMRLESE
jgi:type IV pilus assembly protein PilW